MHQDFYQFGIISPRSFTTRNFCSGIYYCFELFIEEYIISVCFSYVKYHNNENSAFCCEEVLIFTIRLKLKMRKHIMLMILCIAYVVQHGMCQLDDECRIVSLQGLPGIINGGGVARAAEFPWHVGLYDKSSKRIQQICGGTIVDPKLVVTAAHCVYKDGVGPYPASTFAVAAGKLYRRWNSTKDDEQYVQKIDVTKIEIPERYKGAINSYGSDIAVLILEKSFVFSSHVRAVCIRFDFEENLDGQLGRVAGWGLTEEDGHASPMLQAVNLPFVSFEDCFNNSPDSFRPLITIDKFCAGYRNGTALCTGDSGGGLLFPHKSGNRSLHYLYGIVSTSPRNEAMTSCSAFAYTAFTYIIKHQKWLQHWLSKFEKGQCEPLKSSSVEFTCYKQNSTLETSCDQPQDNYTRATAKCKDSYHSDTPLKDLLCINGSWDYKPRCTPRLFGQDCGIVAPQDEKLVPQTDENIGQLPWHVGIYNKTSNPIEQICGGTIFSPKLVVTAASCIYKEGVGLYPAFAVAAGKIYRDWNTPTNDEKYVQKINVSKIEIPKQYRGAINSYAADIAVLVLEKSFVFSRFVKPVCISFDNEDKLNGQYGMVAGWGLSEAEGRASRILQTARLPFVSFNECYDNSPASFRPLITDDKICVGSTNGTALCKDDSGGGLVFLRGDHFLDLYYLYGIVSISPRNDSLTSCSVHTYAMFTDLRYHQDWFQYIWSMHDM